MKRILFGLLVAAGLAGAADSRPTRSRPSRRSACRPSPSPPTTRRPPRRSPSGTSSSTTSGSAPPARWPAPPATTPKKAFTDSPLRTSEGIAKAGKKLTGTRNAPTVVNAAYFDAMFWDGRSPSLEDQSQHPFVNPVEMGLKDHQPILKIVRTDPAYVKAFEQVFGKKGAQVTMKEVQQAIAAFERTKVAGNSPFDRYFYGGEPKAPDRRAEARLRPLRQQGALRLLPRDRADAGPLHRQPLPQHRRRHQRHPEGRAGAGRGVPPGEGHPRRGGREGPRRQADLGARAASPSPGTSRGSAPSRRRRCATWPSPRPTCTTAA